MKINSVEKYRPALHFSPKSNWMNDPNGLVYFKGEYHLFYQHNPNDSVWGPMHWGHAVSKDLITWNELDIALFPDELGTIFSGSAVIDWNNTSGLFPEGDPGIVAIFTHHLDRGQELPPVQTQSLAFSTDQGRTWKKYDGNPVLKHQTKIDFRDPKVFWHEQTNKWIMSLATGQSISFYSSPNLIDWNFESEFGEDIGSHVGVWECPDLFELTIENSNDKKWVLFVSVGDNGKTEHGSRTQYFIGSFDGSSFKPDNTETKWLDFGKDNYAGVSFSDIPMEDGRRIYLSWMTNWRYANQVPTDGWRGQMSLPRELTLRKVNEDLLVVQKPVRELTSYFQIREEISDLPIKSEHRFELNESYADVELTIDNTDAKSYGLKIYHTEDQYSIISIDTVTSTLTLDRSNSGEIDFSDMFSLPQSLTLNGTEKINLRIIMDSSSLEVLVNDGELSLTSLVYPDKTCESISLFTTNGQVNVIQGKIKVPSV
ncbi:glycoside hydrolase family 32 protein [Ornithinibacillus californiensis]|uniref:glycoside hydrolase family 32 protein n=1 Tax=Ornithinibacillus californiensis TaxID=161536 RepID=UPI00069EA19F|nr:glycoside hydrolase family 32 protein [Ornithinibacillus californiensis]